MCSSWQRMYSVGVAWIKYQLKIHRTASPLHEYLCVCGFFLSLDSFSLALCLHLYFLSFSSHIQWVTIQKMLVHFSFNIHIYIYTSSLKTKNVMLISTTIQFPFAMLLVICSLEMCDQIHIKKQKQKKTDKAASIKMPWQFFFPTFSSE